jgi:hypothetical protein
MQVFVLQKKQSHVPHLEGFWVNLNSRYKFWTNSSHVASRLQLELMEEQEAHTYSDSPTPLAVWFSLPLLSYPFFDQRLGIGEGENRKLGIPATDTS